MSTKITGSVLVRSDTLTNWSDASVEGVGANRVLKLGEIGWVIGTFYFKIGDGVKKWSELDYITSGGSEYAQKLGTSEAYHTYNSIQEFMNSVNQSVRELNDAKTLYYNTFSDLPAIGKQGPIYVIRSTGETYFFNVDEMEGVDLGWIKLNGFDILQARFN